MSRYPYGPYRASYISNYDADTIKLRMSIYPDLALIKSCRLFGVDCPEIRGSNDEEKVLARTARDWLKARLIAAKALRVTIHDQGKYGRPIISLVSDGRDVAEMLESEGYARPYFGNKREPWI